MSDLYETLGVEKGATPADIKKAYRRKSMKLHPDRNQSSGADTTKQFQALTRAYEVLSDDDKRQRYDETGQADTSNPSRSDIIEASANRSLLGLFDQVLDRLTETDLKHTDIVYVMRESISEGKDRLRQARREIRRQVRKLRQVKKRLKSADAAMHLHISSKARSLLASWRGVQFDLQICCRVEEKLNDAQYMADPRMAATTASWAESTISFRRTGAGWTL